MPCCGECFLIIENTIADFIYELKSFIVTGRKVNNVYLFQLYFEKI